MTNRIDRLGLGSTAVKARVSTRNTTLTYVTGLGMGVTAGLAIYAAYKGFISVKGDSGKESSQPIGKSTRKKPTRLTVTPVVSPDGAGATVRFDW